jgi:hypothetical protein
VGAVSGKAARTDWAGACDETHVSKARAPRVHHAARRRDCAVLVRLSCDLDRLGENCFDLFKEIVGFAHDLNFFSIDRPPMLANEAQPDRRALDGKLRAFFTKVLKVEPLARSVRIPLR